MSRSVKRGSLVGVGLSVVLVTAVVTGLRVAQSDDVDPSAQGRPDFNTTDPVERACGLDGVLLARIRRGHDPVRSEDVTLVPRQPNFIGTFTLTSHSGPWDYLQRVPLVLYGPGYIEASRARLDRRVEIADVYPTVGELLAVDLPPRPGRVLREALDPDRAGPPKLVVTIVWDGAGSNTLARWPGAWPTLRRLEGAGASYANATVGASPSITSVVHSTLGTGAPPRDHGITGNELRAKNGSLIKAFDDFAAAELRLTTFGDEIDRALGNAPKVGLLGWKSWHLGMLGHGAALPGADRDEAALVKYEDGIKIFGNDDLFEVPDVRPRRPLERHIERIDRADGELDGSWMGHAISVQGEISWATYSNPAWASFQGEMLTRMIERGGYGRDRMPDLLFTNFKMTDLAAHQWSIDAPETRAVLKAQDDALARLVEYLDDEVGDYVLVLTADHGAAPLPENTGAWPIDQRQLLSDLNAHFGAAGGRSLVASSAAFGLYLDKKRAERLGVGADDVAEYLNAYTIRANWEGEKLPEGYEHRGEEQVFSAAFPPRRLAEISRCAAARKD